jgi:hypothetical protein
MAKIGLYLASHNHPLFLRLALLQLEAQTVLPCALAIHENGHHKAAADIVCLDVLARLRAKKVRIIHDHTPAVLTHPFFHYLALKRLVEETDCDFFTKWDHDDLFYEDHLERLRDALAAQNPADDMQWVGQRKADVLVLRDDAYLLQQNLDFTWNRLGGMSDAFMFTRKVAVQCLEDMLAPANKGKADDWIFCKDTLPHFPNGAMLNGRATTCYVVHGRNGSSRHWMMRPPDKLIREQNDMPLAREKTKRTRKAAAVNCAGLLELKNRQEISFREVERRFKEQYPEDYHSRAWTARMLGLVRNLCRTWILVRVDGEQLGKILLGWHRSKADANYDVIPPEGMLVHEVVSELETRIRPNAPEFAKMLADLSARSLGHIFLSEIIPRSDPTYERVIARPGHFISIDGLHRLVAHVNRGVSSEEVEMVVALR